MQSLHKINAALRKERLSVAQACLLDVAASGPVNQTALAKKLCRSTAGITSLSHGLVRRGLAVVTRPSRDARVIVIRPTQSGLAALENIKLASE